MVMLIFYLFFNVISLIIFHLFILKVVDCRVCGDPNSVLRFAFIEFSDEGNFT